MAASSRTISEKANAQGARRNRSRMPDARTGPRAGPRAATHLEEAGTARRPPAARRPTSPAAAPPAGRDQDRRHDQPGQRPEESPAARAGNNTAGPQRGQECHDDVPAPVQSARSESPGQPGGVAGGREEIPEPATTGAGDQDMEYRQDDHRRSSRRQPRAVRPPGSTARPCGPPIRPAWRGGRQPDPRRQPPDPRRTTDADERVAGGPRLATRPADSRKYPRLRNCATGGRQGRQPDDASARSPKSHSAASTHPQPRRPARQANPDGDRRRDDRGGPRRGHGFNHGPLPTHLRGLDVFHALRYSWGIRSGFKFDTPGSSAVFSNPVNETFRG